MTPIKEGSFMHKRLKELSPESIKFFSKYYDGGYYDRATTEYYDENNKKVWEEMGYYG